MSAQAWREELEQKRKRWGPPGVSPLEALKQRSGLAFLQAIIDGTLPQPPMTQTLDFHLLQVDHGRAVFQGEPRPEHYNPIGSVHGGWASTLLDSCMACAVQSTLPVGQGYTTIELKVNLVRALSHDTGPVRAEGKVINAGRTLATAEGRLVDADGKLYAHGTTTCLILTL